MALLQAAVIGLVALIITPGYLFYFDVTPKLVVLLAGVAAIAVFVQPQKMSRPFALLLAASAVSLAISTAISQRPALSLFGTNWRRFGAVEQIAVLLFAWSVVAAGEARTILRGVAVAGTLTAIYGTAQYFGWDPLLPAASYHIGEGIWTIVRPPGTLGYVSYFATWLLAVAFLSMHLAETEKRPIWRAAAALAVVAMLLTGTRASLVGLAAGLAVWLWAQGFRVPRRVIAIGAIFIAAAAAFYYSPLGWQLRSRMRWFVEDPTGGARPMLWRDSLKMAMHRPLAGYGPETFTGEFPHYESKVLARQYPDFAHESPHNIFLDSFTAQGVLGAAALIGLCALALWSARAAPWLCAALAASIVCQQFTAFTIPTALIFYIMAALACSTGKRASPSLKLWSPYRVAGLLAAAAFLYLAARFALADRHLELTRKALDSGDPASAAAEYALARRYALPGTSSDLWYSRTSLALAQKAANPIVGVQALAQSGTAALAATRSVEDPFNAWYQLAILYSVQNNAAEAERALRAAIRTHPNWFKPHWTLARLLLLQRRIPEAAQEAELAADLNGGKNPEVAQTLSEVKSCCK